MITAAEARQNVKDFVLVESELYKSELLFANSIITKASKKGKSTVDFVIDGEVAEPIKQELEKAGFKVRFDWWTQLTYKNLGFGYLPMFYVSW